MCFHKYIFNAKKIKFLFSQILMKTGTKSVETKTTSEMPKPTEVAPFSAPPLTLDWKRALGLVTLAPLRIVILTPLLLLVWATARIGLIGMEEGEPVEEGGYRELLQRINIAIAR